MTAHLVLYRPKPGLDAEAQRQFTLAIESARAGIPVIRRFVIGRRLANGPSYRLGPFPDFPYVAWIEFDDRAGLAEYLEHPAHAALGQVFGALVDAALVYDFDLSDAANLARLVTEGDRPPGR